MKMEGNTILLTGGATGIGLALAESLLEMGNKVFWTSFLFGLVILFIFPFS